MKVDAKLSRETEGTKAEQREEGEKGYAQHTVILASQCFYVISDDIQAKHFKSCLAL